MSAARKVRRGAAAMKPPHGQPCNRCGVCCEAMLCQLAMHVMQTTERAGPCPALLGEPGDTTCGIAANPQLWMPVVTAMHGVDAMREAARLIIGASTGCDARINGERVNAAFNAELERLDVVNADRVAEAKRMWRMP